MKIGDPKIEFNENLINLLFYLCQILGKFMISL